MYSIVSWIISVFPNSVLILIPCAPTFLLSLSRSSSYISQFKRKWSTVSFPPPHSHSEISMILNRCRYSFRWQCPVRNRVSHITCFRCCRTPYNLGPVAVSGCWLSFRSRFAISLPVLHSVSHLIFVMAWMDLFWADLILLMRIVEFGVAAIFAAWSACSLSSMSSCPDIHSIWMLLIGLIFWTRSIISRIFLMIYCPDWRFGDSIVWMMDWLSVKM